MNPIPLKQFTGNGDIITLVKKSIETGRLPHALLFSGPDGIGKKTAAQSFITFLLCENKTDGDFCGSCRGCRLLSAGNHPDFHHVSLSPERKEIGIDTIRELSGTLNKKSFLGGSKNILIEDADRMTTEAANALLKILEEPPGETYFFLVTSNYDSLIPTIRSRVQNLKFTSISSKNIAEYLVKKGFSKDEAEKRSSLAAGSITRALEMDEDLMDKNRAILSLLEKILIENDFASYQELSLALAANRKDFDRIIALCYTLIRDLLYIRMDREAEYIINLHEKNTIAEMAENIAIKKLVTLLDKFDTWTNVNRKNLNLKLNAEDFTISLKNLKKTI